MPHLGMRETDASAKRVGGVPLIRPPQDLRGLPSSLPTFFPQYRQERLGHHFDGCPQAPPGLAGDSRPARTPQTTNRNGTHNAS